MRDYSRHLSGINRANDARDHPQGEAVPKSDDQDNAEKYNQVRGDGRQPSELVGSPHRKEQGRGAHREQQGEKTVEHLQRDRLYFLRGIDDFLGPGRIGPLLAVRLSRLSHLY